MMWSTNTYGVDNAWNSKVVQFNVCKRGDVISNVGWSFKWNHNWWEIDSSSGSHFPYIEYLVPDLLLFLWLLSLLNRLITLLKWLDLWYKCIKLNKTWNFKLWNTWPADTETFAFGNSGWYLWVAQSSIVLWGSTSKE